MDEANRRRAEAMVASLGEQTTMAEVSEAVSRDFPHLREDERAAIATEVMIWIAGQSDRAAPDPIRRRGTGGP